MSAFPTEGEGVLISLPRPEYNLSVQISIICQSPTCQQQGEAINTISGLPPEIMEAFIEAWRGEDRADTCTLCEELGVLDDTTLVVDQPGEDAAYLATLPMLPIVSDKE